MSATNEIKKYNYMEAKIQNINKRYVSISDNDRKRNNRILQELVESIIAAMKTKSQLFKSLYQRVFYGGSYYDNLRVGQPDEFDLDLLLVLPKLLKPKIEISNKPGFVHVQLTGLDEFKKQKSLAESHRGIEKFITEKKNYLDTDAVRKWMEGVVTSALNTFPKQGADTQLRTTEAIFTVKIHKGGPAFTLKAEGTIEGKLIKLDIDLVPCFYFDQENWPQGGFISNPYPKDKPGFFIVPKPLNIEHGNRYWRLSFQEQERVLIDGKSNLKPALRLLKKLRDTQGHCSIASYYLKTVVMWQVKNREAAFWSHPLSYVFMTLLKDYLECLKDHKIPYYWCKKNNLIGHVDKTTISNLMNRIERIIKDIDRRPDDDLVVAQYLLTSQELSCL